MTPLFPADPWEGAHACWAPTPGAVGAPTHLLLEAAHGLPLRVQGGLQGLDEPLRLAVLLLFALQDRLHLQRVAEVVSREGCQVLSAAKPRTKHRPLRSAPRGGPQGAGTRSMTRHPPVDEVGKHRGFHFEERDYESRNLRAQGQDPRPHSSTRPGTQGRTGSRAASANTCGAMQQVWGWGGPAPDKRLSSPMATDVHVRTSPDRQPSEPQGSQSPGRDPCQGSDPSLCHTKPPGQRPYVQCDWPKPGRSHVPRQEPPTHYLFKPWRWAPPSRG